MILELTEAFEQNLSRRKPHIWSFPRQWLGPPHHEAVSQVILLQKRKTERHSCWIEEEKQPPDAE